MSKIGAGELNTRVEIHSLTTTDNGLEVVTSWTKAKTVWGKVTYTSDAERFRGGAVSVAVQARVIIRKTAITHNDKMKLGAAMFNVVGIKPVNSQPELLEVSLTGVA